MTVGVSRLWRSLFGLNRARRLDPRQRKRAARRRPFSISHGFRSVPPTEGPGGLRLGQRLLRASGDSKTLRNRRFLMRHLDHLLCWLNMTVTMRRFFRSGKRKFATPSQLCACASKTPPGGCRTGSSGLATLRLLTDQNRKLTPAVTACEVRLMSRSSPPKS